MAPRAPVSARLIFSFLGVALPIGGHIADMAVPTHIYNDRWPPHAKFHGGQTLAMTIALGLFTLVFAWRRSQDRVTSAWATFCFAVTYPLTQAAAIAYPGTAFFDPEFRKILLLGIPIQLWLGTATTSLAGLATWLSLRVRAPGDSR